MNSPNRMRLGASSMLRRVACNLQLFGLLFLLGGNLLLPIVVHALVDLRALVILPTPAEPAPPLRTASNN